jgi:type III pantothenate kinase
MSMPLLAIDCGNTRLKWGLFEGVRLVDSGALPLIELGMLKRSLPDALPQRVVVSNVAGERVEVAVCAALESRGRLLHWARSEPEQCGVRNGYLDYRQLGSDRWAALIGARQIHSGPCLVVMAGTATTVDFLDGDGVFQGGLILPGFDLMRDSLARNAARLKVDPGRYADMPRSTEDAIVSGCLQAQAGAVDRMYARIAAAGDALCIVSGGAAQALADLLSMPVRLEPHLVLQGLARIGLTL